MNTALTCEMLIGARNTLKPLTEKGIFATASKIISQVKKGFERGSNKDFAKFLFISRGSAGEVRSLLYVAQDLGYISEQEFEENKALCCRIGGALWGLIQHLKKTSNLTTKLSIFLFGLIFGLPRLLNPSTL